MSSSGRHLALVTILLALSATGAAHADGADTPVAEPSPLRRALDTFKNNPLGSFYLEMIGRYEFADIDDVRDSHALTLRTVLGFGSRTWHGFSLLVEGESVLAADADWYFDGTGAPTGRSLVADPEDTDLNQLYLDYFHDEWTSGFRIGRQEIVLDDARFIGNVAWRQNFQSYDAVRLRTGLGRKDLVIEYLYLDEVRRIFGDRGRQPDFDSDSHGARVRYTAFDGLEIVGFSYLLDFRNSPTNSAATYGVRASGEIELDEVWALDWSLSYAHQFDFGVNPLDYDTGYVWSSASLAHATLGALTVGFELLGSDGGDAVFVTPLATAHAFNGFADAFLDNGGPGGLRDAFVKLAPELPWKLESFVTVHWFQSDDRSDSLGWEIDAVVARPIGRYVQVLAKTAYFDARSGGARSDVFRAWLQLSFAF